MSAVTHFSTCGTYSSCKIWCTICAAVNVASLWAANILNREPTWISVFILNVAESEVALDKWRRDQWLGKTDLIHFSLGLFKESRWLFSYPVCRYENMEFAAWTLFYVCLFTANPYKCIFEKLDRTPEFAVCQEMNGILDSTSSWHSDGPSGNMMNWMLDLTMNYYTNPLGLGFLIHLEILLPICYSVLGPTQGYTQQKILSVHCLGWGLWLT